MPDHNGILLTAFEPSGDALAAPVIAALRAARPSLPIAALGGPAMGDSGAQLLEKTTDQAVMLAAVAGQFGVHRRRLKRLEAWLAEHTITTHVAVDSPAANWSICRLVRRLQPKARIVHLAAPQIWAWAPWRIRRLRRLTDLVLCLLPFEPDWFTSRGVNATFVGHPLFDVPTAANENSHTPPRDGLTLALLPGSRRDEIIANWPVILDVFDQLCQTRSHLRGVVATVDQNAAQLIRQLSAATELPAQLRVESGRTRAVLESADAAMVVSGTATLAAAAAGTPMVCVYNVKRWMWHMAGRWLIRTRTFALPNVIAEAAGLGRVVPEFIPHFAQTPPLVKAVGELLDNSDRQMDQRMALDQIAALYAEQCHGLPFVDAAANPILEMVNR